MKRQCEIDDGCAGDSGPAGELFGRLDDAVICLILEALVRMDAVSDYDRAADLIMVARTCKRLHSVVKCQTARALVWSLLDPAVILFDHRRWLVGFDPRPFESLPPKMQGSAIFHSARSISTDEHTMRAIVELAKLSAPTLTSLDVGNCYVDDGDNFADVVRGALELPALRELHIGHHLANDEGTWEVAWGPCPQLRSLTLDRGDFGVFRPGVFPNLRKLALYNIGPTLAHVARAVECCPSIEELELEGFNGAASMTRAAKFEGFNDDASNTRAAKFALAHATALRSLTIEGCTDPIWAGPAMEHASPKLRVLRVRGVGAVPPNRPPRPPDVSRFAELEELELYNMLFFGPEVIAQISSCRRLTLLGLDPIGPDVGPALVDFGNAPGAAPLGTLRLAYGSLDASRLLATPRCGSLHTLSIDGCYCPGASLVVTPRLAETLTEFSCNTDRPLMWIAPVLRACRGIRCLKLRVPPSPMYGETEDWWKGCASEPTELAFTGYGGLTPLPPAIALGRCVQTLTLAIGTWPMVEDEADELAEEFPAARRINLVLNMCIGPARWISKWGNHPLINLATAWDAGILGEDHR